MAETRKSANGIQTADRISGIWAELEPHLGTCQVGNWGADGPYSAAEKTENRGTHTDPCQRFDFLKIGGWFWRELHFVYRELWTVDWLLFVAAEKLET